MEFSEENTRLLYGKITKKLIEEGLRITTMESCTAGLIASLLTDTEGASAALRGAAVTYSNEEKIRQGVPAEIIDKYTVYSAETSAAMAKAARENLRADIALGITGSMGNKDPENPAASVPGEFWFTLDFKGEAKTFYRKLPPLSSRYIYKMTAAFEAGMELYRLLYGAYPKGEE